MSKRFAVSHPTGPDFALVLEECHIRALTLAALKTGCAELDGRPDLGRKIRQVVSEYLQIHSADLPRGRSGGWTVFLGQRDIHALTLAALKDGCVGLDDRADLGEMIRRILCEFCWRTGDGVYRREITQWAHAADARQQEEFRRGNLLEGDG